MNITHDEAGRRFSLPTPAGQAELIYHLAGQVMTITHTFVPPPARGSGVAAQLATSAFEFARQHQLKVVPACPYISQGFLPRHPQYADLLPQA